MGSKKKKQTPKKPVSAAPAVDAITKKRLDLARKFYRERVRSLNSRKQQNPLSRERLDYDEIRAKRRMSAAAALLDEVAAAAKPICPDVEGISDFEYKWLSHKIMPRMSFDWNERICRRTIQGAAGAGKACFRRNIERTYSACSWMPDDRFQNAISAAVDEFLGTAPKVDIY